MAWVPVPVLMLSAVTLGNHLTSESEFLICKTGQSKYLAHGVALKTGTWLVQH